MSTSPRVGVACPRPGERAAVSDWLRSVNLEPVVLVDACFVNTEVGGRFIRSFLEGQIIPVHVVVLLAGVYEIRSARRWVDMEIEMARKHNKPIIGLPAHNKETVPDEVSALCDVNSGWDGARLIATIGEVRALSRYSTPTSLA